MSKRTRDNSPPSSNKKLKRDPNTEIYGNYFLVFFFLNVGLLKQSLKTKNENERRFLFDPKIFTSYSLLNELK